MTSAGRTDCSISQHGDTLWTRKKVEKSRCFQPLSKHYLRFKSQIFTYMMQKTSTMMDLQSTFWSTSLFCFFFSFTNIKIKNKIKHRFSILIRILNHLVIIRSHITKDTKINENHKYCRVRLMPTPTLTPFRYLKHKTQMIIALLLLL